jgi:hypothetical protein
MTLGYIECKECLTIVFLLCYRENDEKIKDDLITKLKSNIPEANITSEVGPGGYYFI